MGTISLQPIPERPRRNFVKKSARTFLLSTDQAQLPIDINSIFESNDWLLFSVEEAEKETGMSISTAFYADPNADAFSCFYKNRYVVIYKTRGKSSQRIRFTKAHEIGHIALGHLVEYDLPSSYSIENNLKYRVLEREADMFAAELLAPTPLLRDIGLINTDYIQKICDISPEAAEIAISDVNKDYDVDENGKNAVLRTFHRFLFAHEYLMRITTSTCPCCGAAVESNQQYCEVCGMMIQDIKQRTPVHYRGPLQTRTGRLLFCPACNNAVFKGGSTKCPICGQPLYNKCPDLEHCRPLPGFARHCPICGKKTSYFSSELLSTWRIEKYNTDIEVTSFSKTINNAPVSVEWHYWVHQILPIKNLQLYTILKDSVATFEYGDLIIFTDEQSLPIEVIEESLFKYCDLEIITITIESGGFTYDF